VEDLHNLEVLEYPIIFSSNSNFNYLQNCLKGDKDADLVPWVCFYLRKPEVVVIGIHTAHIHTHTHTHT